MRDLVGQHALVHVLHVQINRVPLVDVPGPHPQSGAPGEPLVDPAEGLLVRVEPQGHLGDLPPHVQDLLHPLVDGVHLPRDRLQQVVALGTGREQPPEAAPAPVVHARLEPPQILHAPVQEHRPPGLELLPERVLGPRPAKETQHQGPRQERPMKASDHPPTPGTARERSSGRPGASPPAARRRSPPPRSSPPRPAPPGAPSTAPSGTRSSGSGCPPCP